MNNLSAFRESGCKDTAKCAIASRVYSNLMLDTRFCSIDKCYDNSLDALFLKAKQKDKRSVIVLPSLNSQELDLKSIQKLQNNGHEDINNSSSVLLAICDTSSNILYYQITQGFVDKQNC